MLTYGNMDEYFSKNPVCPNCESSEWAPIGKPEAKWPDEEAMERGAGGVKEYIIVSREHTTPHCLAFWGQNFSGYTENLDEAGRFDLEEIRHAYGDRMPNLSGGKDTTNMVHGFFAAPMIEDAIINIGSSGI